MTDPITDKERVLAHCVPEKNTPFSLQEYRERLDRIRVEMGRAGVDVLFVSSPENLYYVSGYQAEWYAAQSPKGWAVGSGLAIHAEKDRYIHFDTAHELPLIKYTSVSTDIRIPPGGRFTLMPFIVQNLKAEGWLSGAVGLEMWSYRPNRRYSELFQAALEQEGARVVDATDVIHRVRKYKSPAELAFTRTAARIAAIGMRAAMSALRPGVSELDVYAEINYAMAKVGGENPGIPIPVHSGPKNACTHGLASRRKIMPGDLVNIDVCGVYNRYHSNLARTFSIGPALPAVADRIAASARSFDVLARVIRPNVRVAEVLEALRAYYKEAGILGNERRLGGYELGIAFPPDWVGPYFYDVVEVDPGDDVFAPGQVVNYESQFYLPEAAGVTLLIDSLMFTETTATLLHDVPRELITIDW